MHLERPCRLQARACPRVLAPVIAPVAAAMESTRTDARRAVPALLWARATSRAFSFALAAERGATFRRRRRAWPAKLGLGMASAAAVAALARHVRIVQLAREVGRRVPMDHDACTAPSCVRLGLHILAMNCGINEAGRWHCLGGRHAARKVDLPRVVHRRVPRVHQRHPGHY